MYSMVKSKYNLDNYKWKITYELTKSLRWIEIQHEMIGSVNVGRSDYVSVFETKFGRQELGIAARRCDQNSFY